MVNISENTRLQLLHGSNQTSNRCFDFNRVQAAVKPGAAAETTTSLMGTSDPHHLLRKTPKMLSKENVTNK